VAAAAGAIIGGAGAAASHYRYLKNQQPGQFQ